ncbi:MAG: hypothetical protein V1644_02445 [Candidatus Micrarchaeota archaeon]
MQLGNVCAGVAEYSRTLTSKEIEKNRQFNQELLQRGLCLAVTRTWGNRTLSTNSSEWRKLRSQVMERDNWACRFCKLRSLKWMMCDHLDGNASSNVIANLGVNCPICDLIRHCGRAGVEGQLSLWLSALSQVDIVWKTQAYWREKGRLPNPQDIDSNARKIADSTIEFANKLLKFNYSELSSEELNYKGFFEPASKNAFEKVISR